MQIKHELVNNAGRFYVEENNKTLAEMDFELPKKNILLITHTEVNDELTGKGIGKQLVTAAVVYARDKSFTLKANCSFAKAMLDKTQGIADVYTT